MIKKFKLIIVMILGILMFSVNVQAMEQNSNSVNINQIIEYNDEMTESREAWIDTDSIKEQEEGRLLPSTGGIGIIIYFVLGAIFIIGGMIFFIRKVK